ncbi:hypothetical protein, partial [Bacteroides heparinolyticus]|uniref:hypothetical protein n=1 Tax=Prevotella heparinolytica TaxID=28113 RepID=UPI003F9FAF23
DISISWATTSASHGQRHQHLMGNDISISWATTSVSHGQRHQYLMGNDISISWAIEISASWFPVTLP